MIEPMYMVVSEGGSVDQNTNQVSVFNVIETIEYDGPQSLVDAEKDPPPIFKCLVTSSWRNTEVNRAERCVIKAEMDLTGGEAPVTMRESEFDFTKSFYRNRIYVEIPLLPPKSGQITFTVSIRDAKKPEGEWVTQIFNVAVVMKNKDQDDESNT